MFYDKTIEIYDKSDGYKDSLGIWHDGDYELIDSFDCDVQPYSRELLLRDYGLDIKVVKQVYLDADSRIKEGQKVVYDDSNYKIEAIPWDDDYYLLVISDM